MMIERLIDKPSAQTAESWLNEVVSDFQLDGKQEWISLGGERALKVESGDILVVHGLKTFQIDAPRKDPSYAVYQQMLATFKFTRP